MDREQVFEKILNVYQSSFDITKPYELNKVSYDAYGYCNITNAKYVLVKKAELWRALCFEHAFFKSVSKLEEKECVIFLQHLRDLYPHKLTDKVHPSPLSLHIV